MQAVRAITKKFSRSSLHEGRAQDQPDEQALIDKIGNEFSHYLCGLWHYFRKDTSHKLDFQVLGDLAIRCESFDFNRTDLRAEHTFFPPMEIKKFKAFKLDYSLGEAKKILGRYLGEWHEPWKHRFYREVDQSNARDLCDTLEAAFNTLYYKDAEDKESKRLIEFTNWKGVDLYEAFQYRNWSTAYFWYTDSQNSQPENVWVAKDKPHIMVTMAHDHAHDDDCLFLGEVQVIIALMIVRLANNSFPDHNVVPVMVFSFTGDKRGRILQAHLERGFLVIRKSNFYDFSARKDTHLELFLQYMLCDLQGTTKLDVMPNIDSIIKWNIDQ